jgi:transcriptional regulator with XRE-family HTH domain
MSRRELARFLRDRREDLRPADVGLPPGTRRRTPGLRREEVAGLASMSVDYYVRLEQARGPRPSARILDGLTGALRLTPPERTHLFRLAGTDPAPPAGGPVRELRPSVTSLLRRMPGAAAVVTDAAYEVLAVNRLASALYPGLRPGVSQARRRFLSPDPGLTSGWDELGRIVVARLRAAADRYPYDARLSGLVAELRAGSDEFAALWEQAPVPAPGHRVKTLDHPVAGRLRVSCDVLVLPEEDQQIVFVTADPGSPSARAIERLAAA